MTPTQAATSYAQSFKNHLSTADQERLSEAFTKGVEWAVADPDVLREILGPFAEWLLENYQQADGVTVWKDRWRRSGTIYTFLEVIEKYIQHLQTIKSKQDDANTGSR